ncbi:hypothetical protein ABPG72_009137 [Tetrahymena utriculariae]
MDQEYYNQEHQFYLIFLILPVLIMVIVIYPLVMLYILYRNRSKMFDITSKNIIRRYGYYFQGFKRNTWWWEFEKTWFKTIILLLSTYFNTRPVIQLVSGNMLVYSIVHNKEYEPFKVFQKYFNSFIMNKLYQSDQLFKINIWKILRRSVFKKDLLKTQKHLDKTNIKIFSFQEMDTTGDIFQKQNSRKYSSPIKKKKLQAKNSNFRSFLLKIDENKDEIFQEQDIEYKKNDKTMLTQDQQIIFK